jgi:type IV secretion system protein VirB9
MSTTSRCRALVVLTVLGGSGGLLAACAATAPPPAPAGELVRATEVTEASGERAPEVPPSTAELVGPDDPDIQAALAAWKAGGQAPIIRKEEFVQYPYGLTEAVVVCQPLRVCDIELETGEEILNVSLGDTGRWLVSPAFSGDRETLTPHVLVKPTDHDIATHAVITTTRRTYYLALVSSGKAEATTHVRRVKFYYPQDLVQQANASFRARAAQHKRDQERTVARVSRVALDSLNFGYQVEGDGVPWKPVRVFDDGTHVYIQMPEAMRVTEAPALFVQTRAGDVALVNYRLRQQYYVVDKLFDSAVLLLGVGDRQERVTIRRTAPRR